MKNIVRLIVLALNIIFKGKTVYKTTIDKTSVIRRGNRVYNSQIDRYTYITKNCLIQNTKVGSFCSISESCYIGMPEHPVEYVSTSPAFLKGKNYLKCNFSDLEYEEGKRTEIGNDVWIGVGVKIKSGVKIGDGAVIGAGAVITKDVSPYAIVGGVPAKIIRYRFDEETIDKLLNIQWWELPDEKIKKVSMHANDPKKLIKMLEEEK